MVKQLPVMLVLSALLVACGEGPVESNAESTTPSSPTSTSSVTVNEAAPSSPATASDAPSTVATSATLTPATYCYTLDNATLTGAVRLTVDAAAQVTGDSRVSIHNEAAGYYSAYAQKFSGSLAGDQANLAVITWIEYDRQSEDTTWAVTPETLIVQDETFTAADCDAEAVVRSFAGAGGLDGAELLGDLANQPGERVQFAPGMSGTTLENAVVRGDRDLYTLSAQGGQAMTLTITSLEDNAVFDVISPSGYVLVRERTNENMLLPQTGDYQIIVGGTRGNATYKLDILIE